jgi:hypothetical protein
MVTLLNKVYLNGDTLTKYDMDESFDLIGCLMKINVFSNVTSLGISPEVERIVGRDKYLNVLDCIKNAPSLKNLKLQGIRVDIDFMEALHDVCPRLETLELCHVLVSTTDCDVPVPVKPVKLLSFTITDGTVMCDENGVFLDYICEKYNQLEALVLLFDFDKLILAGMSHQMGPDCKYNCLSFFC